MSIYTDLTDPSAVEAALNEFDLLGREEFLSRYRFGEARSYVVVREGRRYDSKAIFGVAFRNQHGELPRSSDFSGGKAGAAKRLAELGFEINGPAPLVRRCPRCGGPYPEEIVYGLAAPRYEADDRPLFFAGCEVPDRAAKWHCSLCDHRWGGQAGRQRFTVYVKHDDEGLVALLARGLPDGLVTGSRGATLPELAANVRDVLRVVAGTSEFNLDLVRSDQLVRTLPAR